MSPFLQFFSAIFGFHPTFSSKHALQLKYVLYSISFLLLTSMSATYALYVDYQKASNKKTLRMKSNTAIIVTILEIALLILASNFIVIG